MRLVSFIFFSRYSLLVELLEHYAAKLPDILQRGWEGSGATFNALLRMGTSESKLISFDISQN